jgi:hypothetical protein
MATVSASAILKSTDLRIVKTPSLVVTLLVSPRISIMFIVVPVFGDAALPREL